VLVDARGQVKLLDFGIATLVEAGTTAVPTVTLGGALTPEYAAPEQATGGPVTTATDVYALGVLLYQLLVGRHPTAPAGEAGHAAVLAALSTQEPPRPSEVARRLAGDVAAAAPILEERATTAARLRRSCRGDLDTILGGAASPHQPARHVHFRGARGRRCRARGAPASGSRKGARGRPVRVGTDEGPRRGVRRARGSGARGAGARRRARAGAVGTLEAATTQQASLLPTLTLLARALNADGRHQDALAAAERAAALAAGYQVGQRPSDPRGRALVEVAAARIGLGDHAAPRRATLSRT